MIPPFRNPPEILKDSKYIPIDTVTNCANCPLVYFPVCATDNNTYLNECLMLCIGKGLKKTIMGWCIKYRRNNTIIHNNNNETEISN